MVITDTSVQKRFSHAELCQLAIAGGASSIQFRDKNMERAEKVRVTRSMVAACNGAGIPLIVNDDVELARMVDAAGVHVGRDDMSVRDARALLGPDGIVGATVTSADQARLAHESGATYVGYGHIYVTTSKHKPGRPVGLDALQALCDSVSIPVIAIGGITAGNAGAVIAAGARGVAVLGAVCAAADPVSAARSIRESIAAAANRRRD